MDYDTLEEAVAAAKEMVVDLETIVKITIETNGKYQLFGTGKVVQVVEWLRLLVHWLLQILFWVYWHDRIWFVMFANF